MFFIHLRYANARYSEGREKDVNKCVTSLDQLKTVVRESYNESRIFVSQYSKKEISDVMVAVLSDKYSTNLIEDILSFIYENV